MKKIKIVRITKAHINDVYLFQKRNINEIGNNIWDEKEMKHLVESFLFYGCVYIDQNLVNAICLAKKIDDYLELLSIYVDFSKRKKGVGSSMLKQCEIYCKENHLKKILLEVNKDNKKAVRFYKTNGFLISGKRENYYDIDGIKSDALLMNKKI